jgi:hypothetical protein
MLQRARTMATNLLSTSVASNDKGLFDEEEIVTTTTTTITEEDNKDGEVDDLPAAYKTTCKMSQLVAKDITNEIARQGIPPIRSTLTSITEEDMDVDCKDAEEEIQEEHSDEWEPVNRYEEEKNTSEEEKEVSEETLKELARTHYPEGEVKELTELHENYKSNCAKLGERVVLAGTNLPRLKREVNQQELRLASFEKNRARRNAEVETKEVQNILYVDCYGYNKVLQVQKPLQSLSRSVYTQISSDPQLMMNRLEKLINTAIEQDQSIRYKHKLSDRDYAGLRHFIMCRYRSIDTDDFTRRQQFLLHIADELIKAYLKAEHDKKNNKKRKAEPEPEPQPKAKPVKAMRRQLED